MASSDVEDQSPSAYKIIKAGRFWLLRTKGKTKRISFLDNASEVSITENILVAGDNIFEIDEDENGQISFQRVEDISYKSKDVEQHSKHKVQNKQDLKTKSEYQETNTSSFDDSRNVTECAVPIYDGTKEDLHITKLTVNDICENKSERRLVGSGFISTKTGEENGKDAIGENEVPLKSGVKKTSVSFEDISDRDDELERGHEEYVSLQMRSTEEDSTKEVKSERSAPRKLEDAEVLSGLRLDPLTAGNLSKKDSRPSVQNAQKHLIKTFEPLSYQDENGAYIYILCGTGEQNIVLCSDDMSETKSDAIVISVDNKGIVGSTASVLMSKMSRLASSKYMREVDVRLKKTNLGDLFLTDGYSSGYRYIIHVILQGSAINKPCLERKVDLRKMYENIFKVCQEHKEIQSVAITFCGIDTGSEDEVKMGSREMLNAYINYFVKSGLRLGPMSVRLKCGRTVTLSTVTDVFDFYVTEKKASHENASQRCIHTEDTATEVTCDRRCDMHCHICMETVINIQALECGHAFCYKCLKQHYTAKRTCPICRMIPGEAVNSGKIMQKTEEEILCSEMVWKVISTRHSAELEKLTANFDEFRCNSGSIFVTVTGSSDVSESLLKEFRTFVTRFENKEYFEMYVKAAKDVMAWCNDIERDIGYECCMFEPKAQKVIVYCCSYDDILKVKHLLRCKTGEIMSTSRTRRKKQNFILE